MDSLVTRVPPDAFRATSAYQAAIDFLFGRIDYERVPRMPYSRRDLSLRRMRRLLALLDNPHERLRVIHVAGTNGKGSTTAFLRAALSTAGLRCGAYTSPHLHHVEERFVVGQTPCSPEQFVRLIDRVRPAVQRMDELERDGPTYFEITTAIACEFFVQEAVDLAVLEVGLGGRLDSTNVCQPLVSVITSISYDHTRQLGNSLASIAREKAGIVKCGTTLVSGATEAEAQVPISAACADRSSPLRQLGVDFRFAYRPSREGDRGDPAGLMDFEIASGSSWQPLLERVPLGLLGEHQAANAAVAIATLRELPADLAVGDEAIRRGFQETRCPARIEVFQRRPLTVLDAGHNVASVRALVAALNESLPRQSRCLLVAMTRGKDVEGMLRVLLPEFDRVVCTRYLNNPRGVDPRKLHELASRLSKQLQLPCVDRITWCPDPASAWTNTMADAASSDLVCVSGSFFLAAEIRQLIAQC